MPVKRVFLVLSALLPSMASAAEFDGLQLGVAWAIPFAGLLLSIALMPLVMPDFWHHHFGKVTAAWTLASLGMTAKSIHTSNQFSWAPMLAAISAGAVFMGANTYIGNAPNLMVKAVAEDRGVKMPSFFGYMAWSGAVLIPLFIIMTFIWFK